MIISLLAGRHGLPGRLPTPRQMSFSFWGSLKDRLFGGDAAPPPREQDDLPPPKRYYIGEAADLQDGQMKEVTFIMDKSGRPQKLLLSRIAGKYYATSHLCPHYKAPLVKGVLTAEGRLVCPWHAACFNVTQAGDIEEAPSIEALTTYPVMVEEDKDGGESGNEGEGEKKAEKSSAKLYITIREGETERKDSPTLPPSRPTVCTPIADWPEHKDERTILIIGGGPAGAMAAESARHAGFRGRIRVVSREPHLPIDRIKLSKFLTLQADSILLHRPSYLDALRIEFNLGQQATSVDPRARLVALADGSRLSFDRLLIATGGEPRRLTFLPGGDAYTNVHAIRHLTDNAAILQTIREIVEEGKEHTGEEGEGRKPHVLIIGASFMGMEAASMMNKLAASVTIVGMESVPLERVLGPQVGLFMQRLQEQNGTVFRLGASLKGFLPDPAVPTRARAVELADGTIIETDLVILGVGIRLATEFLLDSGIPLLPDGSLPVDTHMCVQGHPDIFAAGDVATFPYAHQLVSGSAPLRVEHWDVALQQGRIAGHNMAISLAEERQPMEGQREGADRGEVTDSIRSECVSKALGTMRAYDSVPFFFTLQFGKSVRYAGSTPSGYDGIHVDSDGPSMAAYYYSILWAGTSFP